MARLTGASGVATGLRDATAGSVALDRDEKKQARRPVFRSSENAYFTPCISFWISGARASRITPPAISDQKPKV